MGLPRGLPLAHKCQNIVLCLDHLDNLPQGCPSPLSIWDCGAQTTNDTPAGQVNVLIWAGFRVEVSSQLPIVHRSPCFERIPTAWGGVDLSRRADHLIPCFQTSCGAFSPAQFRRRYCVEAESKRSRHRDSFPWPGLSSGSPPPLCTPPLLHSFDFPTLHDMWFCICTVRARLPLLPYLNSKFLFFQASGGGASHCLASPI